MKFIALILIAGCYAPAAISPAIQKALNARLTGQVLELRHSCYVLPLFDENELWLLSPREPSTLRLIDDARGQPIPAPKPVGILAAGTRMVAVRLAPPDLWALTQRVWTTPRFHSWIYLQEVPSPSRATPRTYIMLIDDTARSEAELAQQIAHILAPEGEVTTWLTTLRPTERAAIRHKEVVAGMTARAMEAAVGVRE